MKQDRYDIECRNFKNIVDHRKQIISGLWKVRTSCVKAGEATDDGPGLGESDHALIQAAI